jgi:U3 small nucleolar RNA-associated protein 21
MAPVSTPTHPLDDSSRPRKRPKHNEDGSTIPSSDVRKNPILFAPFRALGFVTNHVPFVLQVRSHRGASQGPSVHIVTCLGQAWAHWEGDKLTLLFVGLSCSLVFKIVADAASGPDVEEGISSLTMEGDAVWAAHGACASKYSRGKEACRNFHNPRAHD